MTKRDLALVVGLSLKMPQSKVYPMVSKVFEELAASVLRGHRIRIANFGTFKLRYRPGGRSRNPYYGTYFDRPPAWTPTFVAGAPFKRKARQVFKEQKVL